jgi:L-ascorbate metabolism protein UlaG (beta-lactamase superfamily)
MISMDLLNGITYCGHASFLLKNGKTVYIDPYRLKKPEKADIVFITHPHYDHLSQDDLSKIMTEKTVIVSPVPINSSKNVILVKPSTQYEIQGIKVKTVPAFNVIMGRETHHPKNNNWVGYIIEFGGRKIYHAGDTDFNEGMKNLGQIDVALIPIGGTYTMDVQEAIEAANSIKAKVNVPMHYKSLLGARAKDAEELFKKRVPGTVLMPEQ